VTSLYPALLVGGEVELLPDEDGAQNLLEALRRRGGRALVKITPAHLDLLRAQLAPAEAAGLTRLFVIGGENLPAESLRFWRSNAPQTRLINEYGPTETVVGCCVYEVQPGDPDHGPVPIGRPIANTELRLSEGELYIGGAGVARGYLNRPELSAEKFAGGLYRTGDLARQRADGNFEYLGRVDSQVKVRGYRIELGEIEHALAGHPGVQACAVMAREDTPGDKQLVAYVVPPVDGPALREFLETRLPDYMVPAQFVFLDALPLTRNGKVDRAALPAPSGEDLAVGRRVEAARTPTESAIGEIWREHLGLSEIGIHEDVFDLGAHSLLAMKALIAIRERCGVDLALRSLFEHPTVAALAALVDGLACAARKPRREARPRQEIEL
jgi:acyl-coenzyme A synthetase/AMP-(fatty) acid ligase/aryl carrier-like protein